MSRWTSFPEHNCFQHFTRRTDRSDRLRSTVDHLDNILQLWDVVQDLWSTDILPRKHVQDHAGYTAPTRQHELDHTDQGYIYIYICISTLKYLRHEEVWTWGLYNVKSKWVRLKTAVLLYASGFGSENSSVVRKWFNLPYLHCLHRLSLPASAVKYGCVWESTYRRIPGVFFR